MQILKSLTRGLKVIEILSESPLPIRLIDISKKLESKKSNTSHILKSLMVAGYVNQDSSRRYYLNNKLKNYPQSYSVDNVVRLKEKFQPILKELSLKTGECTYLAVRANNKVWYIDKFASSNTTFFTATASPLIIDITSTVNAISLMLANSTPSNLSTPVTFISSIEK